MDEPVMTPTLDEWAECIAAIEDVMADATFALTHAKRKYWEAGGPTDPLALQAHIDALRAREEER